MTDSTTSPHFHVYYAEYEASVGVDGELLAGSLPVKQLKPVQAWADIHEDELYEAWNKAIRHIYLLWLRFNTGEARIFDFKPLLDSPAFAPLAEKEVFRDVYIDYGIPVWMDGDIDISPEYLYKNSVPQGTASA